jgi:hypothetical protein
MPVFCIQDARCFNVIEIYIPVYAIKKGDMGVTCKEKRWYERSVSARITPVKCYEKISKIAACLF